MIGQYHRKKYSTTMKHKHLRPWVINVMTFFGGLVSAIAVICGYCYAFEAFTGINPIDIVRGLIG